VAKDLLFEIGTEEIPSVFIPGALEELATVAGRVFEDARLGYGSLRTLATPRRLTLYVEGMEEVQKALAREVVGPAKAIAFDEQGQPTKAAFGFAKAQGVPVEKLQVKALERGEYVVAVLEEKGVRTRELLPTLLPRIITSLSFPKSMRWGFSSLRFVRPIRWILALYGGRVVEFEVDGIKSSNRTYGHRFLSPKPVKVKDFQDYVEKLERKYVIVDQERRKEMVKERAQEVAARHGGRPVLDEDFLTMVANLVEYPAVVCGSFREEYLQLPEEVVISPLRKHQRYFPVMDEKGRLLPYFVAISNMITKDMDAIREGNEQVLRARLADAAFFYEEDKKVPLADRVPKLVRIIFQEQLGTVYDKAQRMVELASFLAERIDPSLKEQARRAALLAKADLLTQMVKEFPALQGIIGREYARLHGESEKVAFAIEEHYPPRFAGDRLPETTLGAIVGIADKIDSIVGCIGVGLTPTGSEDPYALRRAATGVVQVILERGFRISLKGLVQKALELCRDRLTRDAAGAERDIMDFMRMRLQMLLVERELPPDFVEAALSVGFDDMVSAARRAGALTELRQAPDFVALTTTFKRVVKILPPNLEVQAQASLFKEEAERYLHEESLRLREDVSQLLEAEDYAGALRRIAAIRPAVDRFFEEVMVMVEDRALRENRLALLQEVANLFSKIADFTKIAMT